MMRAMIAAYLILQVGAILLNPIAILAVPIVFGILVAFYLFCKHVLGLWGGMKTRPDRGEML